VLTLVCAAQILGTRGHSHVDPAPLFDPERAGRPPDDAWDLYFHALISLSLLGDAYATHGMERELGQLLSLHAGLATATVIDVRRQRDGRERRPGRADHAPAHPCLRGPHRDRPPDQRASPRARPHLLTPLGQRAANPSSIGPPQGWWCP